MRNKKINNCVENINELKKKWYAKEKEQLNREEEYEDKIATIEKAFRAKIEQLVAHARRDCIS